MSVSCTWTISRRQLARVTLVLNAAVGCHYLLPRPRLPSRLQSASALGRYQFILLDELQTCLQSLLSDSGIYGLMKYFCVRGYNAHTRVDRWRRSPVGGVDSRINQLTSSTVAVRSGKFLFLGSGISWNFLSNQNERCVRQLLWDQLNLRFHGRGFFREIGRFHWQNMQLREISWIPWFAVNFTTFSFICKVFGLLFFTLLCRLCRTLHTTLEHSKSSLLASITYTSYTYRRSRYT